MRRMYVLLAIYMQNNVILHFGRQVQHRELACYVMTILTNKQTQTQTVPRSGLLVEELCGRLGAVLGDAATAAIHFEAMAEWIRSTLSSSHRLLAVAARARLRLAPRSFDTISSRSISLDYK